MKVYLIVKLTKKNSFQEGYTIISSWSNMKLALEAFKKNQNYEPSYSSFAQGLKEDYYYNGWNYACLRIDIKKARH